MSTPEILIIGGGAAGLAAACWAARAGAAVTVLERLERVGKKILATGNGRCNLGNRRLDPSRFHGGDPAFVADVLRRCDGPRVWTWLEELGIEIVEEEDGKLFPASGQASAVLDVLRYENSRLGVREVTGAGVQRLERRSTGYGAVCADGRTFRADRVVAAGGGRAAANLGSDGSLLAVLGRIGLRQTPLFPALVPLKLGGSIFPRLKGVKVQGRVSVLCAGHEARRESGEVLFTDYGLSGPPVLQVSRTAVAGLQAGTEVQLVLDLFPDRSLDEVARFLLHRFTARPDAPLDFSLVGFLHKRLIPVVRLEAGFSRADLPAGQVDSAGAARFAAVLKEWRFPVTGPLSWNDAQVTAGGLDLSGFSPATLEARRFPGLFAAGEILDVDGDCGGFNLQWAWSTGILAGLAAAGAEAGRP